MLGIVFALIAAIVAVFVGGQFFGGSDEFAGDGKADIVIQVHDGDSTTAIGQTLVDNKVIATVRVRRRRPEATVRYRHPAGLLQGPTEVPRGFGCGALADPGSRVGKVVIPEGVSSTTSRAVGTGAVTQGIFTWFPTRVAWISTASEMCCGGGSSRTAARGDGGRLERARVGRRGCRRTGQQPSAHRGLIAPGTWNVNPAGSGPEILSALIAESVTHYVNGESLDTARR